MTGLSNQTPAQAQRQHPGTSKRRATALAIARWAMCLVVSGVFAFASIPKIADGDGFAADIANYRLFPDPLIPWLALGLPCLELVTSVCLLVPRLQRGAAVIALLMLVGFSLGIGQALARGIDIECGCFGEAMRAQAGGWALARNALFMAMTAAVLRLPRSQPT